ncbi:MAG: hypothetical protein OXC41_02070 [Gammaproteobacteria bacterium]|nr:hypothetical protein [Gammaproteobacteria bacterium]
MLVPEQRRLEALASSSGGKVKGPTPSELVEIGHQVVVVINEYLVMLSSVLRANIVEPGVLIDDGFYFIRGEPPKGTRTRSFGDSTRRSIILRGSHDFSRSRILRE